MVQSFQDAVDTMLTTFGIIPSITVVIFPMTFITFLLVSAFDSSTTVKRGIRLFFYIGAPINIFALFIITALVYTGVVNNVYVDDIPSRNVNTVVETITTDTLFKDNDPNNIVASRLIETSADITLSHNNTPSEIEYLDVGDRITVKEYDAKVRNLFTPATDVSFYTISQTEELAK